MILNIYSKSSTALPPLSRIFKSSTVSEGSFETLARVRLRTFPSSRYDSRSRTAGGEFLLGIRSIYMTTIVSSLSPQHINKIFNYMGAGIFCKNPQALEG